MRQMPPGLFNVRGYDRNVYKTSSVIYTVIPREGLETSASFALSFRFFFSFLSFPGLGLVPGIRSPRLPFPPSPPTNPKGCYRDGALSLASKEGACQDEGTIVPPE